jgi:hypothetical protein
MTTYDTIDHIVYDNRWSAPIPLKKHRLPKLIQREIDYVKNTCLFLQQIYIQKK